MSMRTYAGDLSRDARLALRQMKKRPLVAVVTVMIIGFSVGATAAVFAVADGALLRPLPFADGDRLFFLTDTQGTDTGLPASLPELNDWRASTAFASISAFHSKSIVFQDARGAKMIPGAGVIGDVEKTLRLPALKGRWMTAQEQRSAIRVVVLGEQFWREQFASRVDILGSTIRLDDHPYVVVGIAPHAASVIRAGKIPSVWIPVVETEAMGRGLHFLSVVGRLADGMSAAGAASEIDQLQKRLVSSGATDHGIGLASARDLIVGDSRALLLILCGATLLMLLIACANLANLFVSRSIDQSHEFAVRAALGARPWQLARQALMETIINGLVGGAVGIAVANLSLGIIARLARRAGTLAPVSALDPRVVAFTLVTAVAAGWLFGLWPAVRALRQQPSDRLRGTVRMSAGRATVRGRRFLVMAEVALSLVLLTGGGLLVRSMLQVLKEDPGFTVDDVLTFNMSMRGDRYADEVVQAQTAARVREQIAALPGVVTVAAASHIPLDGSDTNGSFEIVGTATIAGDDGPIAKKRVVSDGFFDALSIHVRSGRAFSASDVAGAPDVVIISELIARRYFPGTDAIGKRIRFGWGPGDEQTIVGVVDDVRHDGLDVPVEQGTIYRPAAQFPMRALSFVVRTDEKRGPAVAAALRTAVAAVDAALPVSAIRPMSEIAALSTAARRTLMILLTGLAGIAVLIASVGVYAITRQAVTRRTAEFGIRLALGAGRADVVGLAMRDELITVGLGIVLGLGGAVAGASVLQSSLYGVRATDPLTLAIVGTGLGVVALGAALVPAVRAARIAPSSALRGD